MQHIEMIVLEGGPCGGKSSAIPRIKQHFKKEGWMVLVSSEVPTRLVNEHDYTPGENISLHEFQRLVLGEVLRQEKELLNRAKTSGHDKVLILCDRGRFGGLGYVSSHDDFYSMAREEFGLEMSDIFRDYSGCVFLQSLAVDRPDLYKEHMSSNEARRERSVDDARVQNERSLNACVGVPRLYVVDNRGDFDNKVMRVIAIIAHLVNGSEYERKYTAINSHGLGIFMARQLLRGAGVHFVELNITQNYLTLQEEHVFSGYTVRRVRTEQFLGDTCDKKLLTLKGDGLEYHPEEEIPLDDTSYNHALNDRDMTKNEIKKTRFLFIWNDRYYELDVFHTPKETPFILEVEHVPHDVPLYGKLPPWFGALRDATNDLSFSNVMIASKK